MHHTIKPSPKALFSIYACKHITTNDVLISEVKPYLPIYVRHYCTEFSSKHLSTYEHYRLFAVPVLVVHKVTKRSIMRLRVHCEFPPAWWNASFLTQYMPDSGSLWRNTQHGRTIRQRAVQSEMQAKSVGCIAVLAKQYPAVKLEPIRPAPEPLTRQKRLKKVLILAQGPCSSSLYRSNFNMSQRSGY